MDLRPGELTLLMGPSGSGKTTLLFHSGLHPDRRPAARSISPAIRPWGLYCRRPSGYPPPARGLRVPELQSAPDADRARERARRTRCSRRTSRTIPPRRQQKHFAPSASAIASTLIRQALGRREAARRHCRARSPEGPRSFSPTSPRLLSTARTARQSWSFLPRWRKTPRAPCWP